MKFRAKKTKRIGAGFFLEKGHTIELLRNEGINDPDLEPVLEAPDPEPVMEKGQAQKSVEAPEKQRPIE